MDCEIDPCWRRFYRYGFEYGAAEAVRREHGIRIQRDPREKLRAYRVAIRRALGVTDATREALRAIAEGIADARAGREPRC
jgi:hypothetical protein